MYARIVKTKPLITVQHDRWGEQKQVPEKKVWKVLGAAIGGRVWTLCVT